MHVILQLLYAIWYGFIDLASRQVEPNWLEYNGSLLKAITTQGTNNALHYKYGKVVIHLIYTLHNYRHALLLNLSIAVSLKPS